MKKLKIIGIILLLIAIGYASNWDLPKEEKIKRDVHYIEVNGQRYYGTYVDGIWYEPLEVYAGALPEELMEGEENE